MAISSERAQAQGTDAPCAPASTDEFGNMSGDDRRQHIRHTLQLDATVGFRGGLSRPCRIQDFCPGGLFLAVEGANGVGIVVGDKPLERFDELTVGFSANVNGTETVYGVEVLVARVVAGGVGVSFEGKNGKAIHALNHLLATSVQNKAQGNARAAVADGTPGDVAEVAGASSILAACRGRVLAFLDEAAARFGVSIGTHRADVFEDVVPEALRHRAAGIVTDPFRSAADAAPFIAYGLAMMRKNDRGWLFYCDHPSWSFDHETTHTMIQNAGLASKAHKRALHRYPITRASFPRLAETAQAIDVPVEWLGALVDATAGWSDLHVYERPPA